ncbi:MAG TPA: glycosyltransferase family 1 protein [Candidatus Hydrogenedentes bacterium]|nr:glycosyltransferase family 1 protein [Candidatus Hydrogenedentota bacterium]
MILGFDARLANAEKRAGVGHYTAELLRALAPHMEEDMLRLYLDAAPVPEFPLSTKQAEICVLPKRRFWTHRMLGRELRQRPPDVFFSPVTQLPLFCPCPAIVVVHDLAFFDFGGHFTFRQRHIARLQAGYVARHATHLIADSQATLQDIQRLLHVPEHRVTVAPLGCSAHFRRASEETVQGIRARYQLPDKFILYVGRLQPRKNIARLIEAFARVIQRRDDLPHHLVLAGDKGWMEGPIYHAARGSSARDRIHFLGYVPEADLPGLMSAAEVLGLVSLWEGFGLPVVEAMACGTAVITSNCSSLPEVAGNAAALVNPYDVDDIARALERVIVDNEYHKELQQRGLVQAARFTWDSTARIVMEAIRSVLPKT